MKRIADRILATQTVTVGMKKTADKGKAANMRSATDYEGSYTGNPVEDGDDMPVQDADDL